MSNVDAVAVVSECEVVNPEIVRDGPLQAIDLHDAPAWMSQTGVDHLRMALHWHAAAAERARCFATNIVLCGIELNALKSVVGHGRWGQFVTDHLEMRGMSGRTIRLYMTIGKRAAKMLGKRLQGAEVDPARLLADPNAMDHQAASHLGEAVKATTTADTWRELLEDFGVTAKSKGRGGFHPRGEMLDEYAQRHGLDQAAFDDWTNEQRADFRAWAKAERKRKAGDDAAAERKERGPAAAAREWKPLVEMAVKAAAGNASWRRLPKSGRVGLRNALRSLVDLIEATL